MADKIYCGNGKKFKTQYGDMMKLSFSRDDIQKLVEQSEKSESGWVNVVVKERREPSERGTTHYLEIDTWEPNKNENPAKKAAGKATPDEVQLDEEITAEDLPF